jgi:hypothetical protein
VKSCSGQPWSSWQPHRQVRNSPYDQLILKEVVVHVERNSGPQIRLFFHIAFTVATHDMARIVLYLSQ